MGGIFIVIQLLVLCVFGLEGAQNVTTEAQRLLIRRGKFMESNKRFHEKVKSYSPLPFQGANFQKLNNNSITALDHLKKKASRGIVLRLENFSNRILADPVVWTRCGYQDKEYMVPDLLQPGSIDISILHNYGELRSSCGSISWEVMEHSSRPYRLADGKGLRLYMTWSNLDTVGSNKCKYGKPNEFIVGFKKVELDDTGHYSDYYKKEMWNTVHTKEMFDQHIFQFNKSLIYNKTRNGPSSMLLVESPDSTLEVRAEMDSGCMTNLTIQLLGKRKAELQPSDLGLAVAKYSDEVWEQMIRQAWQDIVTAINRDRALYGVSLEPLIVDPLLKEPISVNTTLLGYEIEFLMWNVSIAGLGDVKLEKLLLEREESLKNLETQAILDIGNLSISGRYQYKAIYTGWVWGMSDMDSEGPQNFNVDMTGAKFNVELGMDVVNGCNLTENLILSNIALPLEYQTVNFNFENIGSVLSSVVSVIGEMSLEFSKGIIVDLVKDAVKSELPTFICDSANKTSANLTKITLTPELDTRWHDILENGTKGWGVNTLRRDILAEKFVTKVFNEGVGKHFADPKDPIVKLLDPFQLLPVDEDFRKPGLVKGHVVVCEFWLYHLSKLHLIDMKLARNDDLTYSALSLRLGLPTARVAGKYRLNNVKVMSVLPAPKSEGTVDISLTGVTVDLRVVLRAKPVTKAAKNAAIKMELFEVEFGHDNIKLNITGLAKGLNTITNKVSNALGNKILKMQKEVLNTEIKNILFGFADCLMYKPAMGIQTCMDKFWESLGFKVPFEFPLCQEIYNKADRKLGLI